MFINEGYGDCDNDWQPEIVIWPPKPEVLSGTMIDSVKISTTILEFSTVLSSKKVPTNDCANDRQPEIAIWPPKPEILTTILFY